MMTMDDKETGRNTHCLYCDDKLVERHDEDTDVYYWTTVYGIISCRQAPADSCNWRHLPCWSESDEKAFLAKQIGAKLKITND